MLRKAVFLKSFFASSFFVMDQIDLISSKEKPDCGHKIRRLEILKVCSFMTLATFFIKTLDTVFLFKSNCRGKHIRSIEHSRSQTLPLP